MSYIIDYFALPFLQFARVHLSMYTNSLGWHGYTGIINVHKLISPYSRIYVAVNRVSKSSDDGLLPIRRQAIILTSAGLLSIGPLGTNFSEILITTKIFIHENASETVVCEMAVILSRERWGKAQVGHATVVDFVSVHSFYPWSTIAQLCYDFKILMCEILSW